MKTLVVEDDFGSRKMLQKMLSVYGSCDVAVDGKEAVKAFKEAWKEADPYDLICMDIMMPTMNGHDSLKKIRDLEKEMGIVGSSEAKVIMVTALEDPQNVIKAFYREGATSYLVKPVSKQGLNEELKKLGLISTEKELEIKV